MTAQYWRFPDLKNGGLKVRVPLMEWYIHIHVQERVHYLRVCNRQYTPLESVGHFPHYKFTYTSDDYHYCCCEYHYTTVNIISIASPNAV